MSAKEIFDKALTIKPGQTLLVPCHDFKQQESLRVSLAYQRRMFLQTSGIDFDIIASKVTKGGKPFVSLTKMPRIETGFLVEEDGKVETVSLKPTPLTEIGRDALDVSRLRQAMLEDGMSEADIAAYFADSQETSNFDASEAECSLKEEKDA